MIIEFTGCTSVGKSTLLLAVAYRLREEGRSVVCLPDPEAMRRHPTLTNFTWDLRTFSVWPRSFKKHHLFFSFAWDVLKRMADSKAAAINLLRSVTRKINVLEWAKRRFPQEQIILLDEGPLHAAHQLFVHHGSTADPENIRTFVEIAPKPDAVVFVSTPLETLLVRTARREDPSRRALPGKTEDFIGKARSLFKAVFEKPIISLPVIVVENDGQQSIEELAEGVTSQILALDHVGSR